MRRRRAAAAGCALLVLATGAGACGDASHPTTTAKRAPRATTDAPVTAPRAARTPARTVATAAQTTTSADTVAAEPSTAPRKPTIIDMPIPFDAKRKREMAAYSKRHYGVSEYRLLDPKVIVEHFTVTDTVAATYNTFAPDVADPELHELPGVCSHFVIGKDGRIFKLVSLRLRCRHTVGLNDRSFGIEHVGRSDAEILDRPAQLAASLRLTAWLRCRYKISVRNVIGHNESLSSPYHHEDVPRLRDQTHDDFKRAAMQIYRRKLRRYPCG